MTTLLLWVVRVLVLLALIRFVLRLVTSRTAPRQASRPSARVPERSGGVLVRDPQCGTYIPESRAVVVGQGAGALHFCSTACRDAWAEARSGARVKA
jgi:hypothetical protein